MREKFRQGGGEALADHEILEMLLFYSIPRINTNEATHQISEGSVNEPNVDVRQIMEYAIMAKASHIVLAHNHPDPMLTPSPADESVSISLMHAASIMESTCGSTFWCRTANASSSCGSC